MKTNQNKIYISSTDFALLDACVKNTRIMPVKEQQHTRSLSDELSRAVVVDEQKFPDGIVKLNSRVTIKDLSNGNEISLVVVLPELADIKQKRISVLAPMGTALIGFKQGQTVKWQMPAGEKQFLIVDVRS
ncbi:MAG: transcription elongation factor GreAB [Chitinophagaceae bacterium]|nr:MAG: transcription elongation factor GreAB [Chitinophagaceae bacterium]